MWEEQSLNILAIFLLLLSGTGQAASYDVTQPGDYINGVPNDHDWLLFEAPCFAIDDNRSTKYVHFKGDFNPDPLIGGTGFCVSPAIGRSVITGIAITTANDNPGRDPIAFEIYGSNASIDGPYDLISFGSISALNQNNAYPRFARTMINFSNSIPYTHYQLIFTAIRNPGEEHVVGMQVGDVELLGHGFTARLLSPPDGAIHSDTWIRLSWIPGYSATLNKVYFGEEFDDVEAGTPNTFLGSYTTSSINVGLAGDPYPDSLVPDTTYYWRVDEINLADPDSPWKGDVWSFTVPPRKAYNPDPADGAQFINPVLTLSWTPGLDVDLHRVYFGESFDDVNNGTAGVYKGELDDTTYTPRTLELDKVYYWRVDELGVGRGGGMYKGDIWSYTTGLMPREYHVSATDGDDNNPGTQELPFKTISRACDVIQSDGRPLPFGGLTVWIGKGIYRETVRPPSHATAEAPLRFVALPGEEPVVSGSEILVLPWEVHSGNIYKATTKLHFEQLFVDGQMMQEARWPNNPIREPVRIRRGTCDDGTNNAILFDDDLPQGNWNNAWVQISPSGLRLVSKQIRNYRPGISLEFTDTNWGMDPRDKSDGNRATPGNRYYLSGALAGLDRATEWFLDNDAHTLYLWCSGNPNPASHKIEIKRRTDAFDLSGCQYVYLEGLRVFAGGIVMDDSKHCSVIDCHLKYPLHKRIIPANSWLPRSWKTNYMSGSYNEWKNTAIAFSAGYGIMDKKGSHNKVTNCIIHDWDLGGGGADGFWTNLASFGEYTHNTICEGCTIAVHLYNADNARFEHNHVYNTCSINWDSRIMWVTATPDSGVSTIAYNLIHDNLDRADGCGLQIQTGGYKIHHNLIWNIKKTAFRMDNPCRSPDVYNNTVFNCGVAFKHHFDLETYDNLKSFGCTADMPRQPYDFINNIANGPILYRDSKTRRDQHICNEYYMIDNHGWPTLTSGAIDAGVVIPGVTDGYVGLAPDIGCFEIGTEGWQAGADWEETAFTRSTRNCEGFETGDFLEFDWNNSPDWVITSEETYSGFYSAQCSGLNAGEQSTLEVMVKCYAGELSFYRKISSHGALTSLVLEIDGVSEGQWSGDMDWEQVFFPVTYGTHTFRWTYFKHSGTSIENAAAWIDDIKFSIDSVAYSGVPCFTRIGNTEGFESGDFLQYGWCKSPIRRAEKPGWIITSEEKNSGFYSAQCSGPIIQTSDMELFLNCHAGNITFYRKVDSHYDKAGIKAGLMFSIDGVLVGEWSGDLDWEKVSFPVIEGAHTFRWTHIRSPKSQTENDFSWIDDIEFPIDSGDTEEPTITEPNSEGFETGDFSSVNWELSGDVNWFVTSEERNSGTYSARAGSIEDDERSTLRVELDCTSSEISFHCKVSSESGFDYLNFYIDGVEQDEWSGEQDWVQVSFPVKAGTRTFEWTYSKDGSMSEGEDTAWIDDIVFPIN